MKNGVFLDRATVSPRDLDFSGMNDSLENWTFYDTTELAEIEGRVADAEVIVTNKVLIDEYTLQKTPHLKLICVAATGVNNVDLEACQQQNICVTNCTGYSTPSVVQHTFGLIISLNMALTKYHARVVRGAWENSYHFCLLDFPVTELAGKQLGLIGYGDIGRAVAKVAEAFGMQVSIAQLPHRETKAGRTPLKQLLADSDIVSIHCPLNAETENLIDQEELGLMKRDALLINTARGGIVNEAALADALLNKRIGGAGIDVLTQEPPKNSNPLLNSELPNIIVTPHTAWTSKESRQRLINQITDNINAFKAGKARNIAQ